MVGITASGTDSVVMFEVAAIGTFGATRAIASQIRREASRQGLVSEFCEVLKTDVGDNDLGATGGYRILYSAAVALVRVPCRPRTSSPRNGSNALRAAPAGPAQPTAASRHLVKRG